MSPRTRMIRPFAVLLTAALLLTSACGSDDDGDAEPSEGQVERTETVTASNLAIITDGEGRGVLVGTLVNDGDGEDRLVDVAAEGELEFPVEVELVDGPVALPPSTPVRLADDPAVVISSDRLVQGFRAPLELTFESSKPIVTTVTVEPRTDPYADIEIPPAG